MIDQVSLAKEHARLVQGLNGNQRRRYMMLWCCNVVSKSVSSSSGGFYSVYVRYMWTELDQVGLKWIKWTEVGRNGPKLT